MFKSKRYNIFIDGQDIIYQRNILTYEKLCKAIKKREKVKIYVLSNNIYFKILDYVDKEKIIDFLEQTFAGNEDYLIDYKIIRGKTYIYAIRGNTVINELLMRYEKAIIKPIEFKMKELLSKSDKNIKYKIKFMKKDFYIEIEKDILIFNKNIVENEYLIGRLILNENKEKVIING